MKHFLRNQPLSFIQFSIAFAYNESSYTFLHFNIQKKMSGVEVRVDVNILEREPNSLEARFSQFVKKVQVSKKIAEIYEAYKNGEKTIDQVKTDINGLGCKQRTVYSVFLNVHETHASVCFIECDSMKYDCSNGSIRNSLKLRDRGLDSYFEQDRFELYPNVSFRQVDLYIDNRHEYRIGMTNVSREFSKAYEMFKCFEIIGFSFYEIEWAYLMAAQEWYDMATNNCLVFSKRFVGNLYKQMTGDDLGKDEINKMEQLYISSASEVSLHDKQSRVSFFLSNILPWIIVGILVFHLFLQWRTK